MLSIALLAAVGLLAWSASVAFARLSGKSALTAMRLAITAVIVLTLLVSLLFVLLARQFV